MLNNDFDDDNKVNDDVNDINEPSQKATVNQENTIQPNTQKKE